MTADRAGVALVLAGLAGAAAAQELGVIEARLDGKEQAWETRLDGPGGGAGSTGHSRFDALHAVSLLGYPLTPVGDARLGVIMLQFTVPLGRTRADDPRIAYYPDAYRAAFVADDDGGAEILLERFDTRTATAAGRFAARLCHRPDPLAKVDPDRCIAVEGRFDSAVPLSD